MNKFRFKYNLLIGLIFLSAFSLNAGNDEEINWLSIDEAVKLQKEQPKKIIIYIYTDWCTYCKVMKRGAFKNETSIKYLNDNFYAVKFNAEQTQDIVFKDKIYSHRPTRRKGGFHDLADGLVNYELYGYPTLVVYDENLEMQRPFVNYLKQKEFQNFIEYFNTDSHKTIKWEEY